LCIRRIYDEADYSGFYAENGDSEFLKNPVTTYRLHNVIPENHSLKCDCMVASQSEKRSCSKRKSIGLMTDRIKFDDFGEFERHYVPRGTSPD
jgi:hypothetical protein